MGHAAHRQGFRSAAAPEREPAHIALLNACRAIDDPALPDKAYAKKIGGAAR
jgi:hypothetical protein